MNKELREDLEHLIICKDKSITPDLRDDIKMTLDYIDELENNIDKAIEYIEDNFYEVGGEVGGSDLPYQPIQDLLDILRGKDNE